VQREFEREARLKSTEVMTGGGMSVLSRVSCSRSTSLMTSVVIPLRFSSPTRDVMIN